MMTGVSPLTYWGAAFSWDFFIVLIVICAMTACFPIFENYSVFTSYGGAGKRLNWIAYLKLLSTLTILKANVFILGVAFLILLLYGYSSISFSYVISLFSSTVAGGFAFVSIIHIASGKILKKTLHTCVCKNQCGNYCVIYFYY